MLARLGARTGGDFVSMKARAAFASDERRDALRGEFELRSAEQVTEVLGNMKGALMKIGQMASYLDQGLPEPVRDALADLQIRCAAHVGGAGRADGPLRVGGRSRRGLRRMGCDAPGGGVDRSGAPRRHPRRCRRGGEGPVPRGRGGDESGPVEHRPVVRAAGDDVHRAWTPSRSSTRSASGWWRSSTTCTRPTTSACSPTHFRGHPFIHIPEVVDELSSQRVLTTELAEGARFADVVTLVPGRARPGRRVSVPVRLRGHLRPPCLQRRPASRQLPVRSRRPRHLPGLRIVQAVQRRRGGGAGGDDPGPRHSPGPGRVPRHPRADRDPDPVRGRVRRDAGGLLQPLLRVRARRRGDGAHPGVRDRIRPALLRSLGTRTRRS